MTDDPIDFDIVISRKPEPRREVLFTCLICGREVEKPSDWRLRNRALRFSGPICFGCTSQWGSKCSGPVFNRRNYQILRQLSAITNCLQWEIKNGHRYR
ncbi:hypothetical protein [Sinorhizobium americanum]|uniref:Uncharacterized protein n=1 Tax=Sinorhizobium americanum TaxID=194963 RepID=A0A4V2REW2_9HYPH|nr:hypothetical protein [Sinorhizobium americanum]TCN30290.1 hypothetical protein EV184_108164 [Sinorhizobium americanum]